MLFRSRWYCCIIGVSASCIMKFTLPASIERQQTSSVRFSIGKTTKYNRECAAEANGAAIGAQKKGENLHGISVKRADFGRFDGPVSAEYSPAHRLTIFSKARGVIIDARSDCAQR